jgi:hypothetical protein
MAFFTASSRFLSICSASEFVREEEGADVFVDTDVAARCRLDVEVDPEAESDPRSCECEPWCIAFFPLGLNSSTFPRGLGLSKRRSCSSNRARLLLLPEDENEAE